MSMKSYVPVLARVGTRGYEREASLTTGPLIRAVSKREAMKIARQKVRGTKMSCVEVDLATKENIVAAYTQSWDYQHHPEKYPKGYAEKIVRIVKAQKW